MILIVPIFIKENNQSQYQQNYCYSIQYLSERIEYNHILFMYLREA